MTEASELVVVRAFLHPHEAYMACSALQAAGLDAAVTDAHIVEADWLVSNAVGGVKVVVRAEDADAARDVLDRPAIVEKDDEPPPSQAGGDVAGARCPQCGSENVVRVARGKRLAVLSWMIVGVPLFPVWRNRRCRSCGFLLS